MMKTLHSQAPLLGVIALGALALPTLAQEQDEEWFPPEFGPPPGAEEEHDHTEDIVEIFHSVEGKLRQIDVLLLDAGAGEIPLQQPEDSGISKLLVDSQRASRDVVAGIDKLLELAQGT